MTAPRKPRRRIVTDADGLARLIESAAHWARLATGTWGEDENISEESCACCARWIRGRCRGCPIAANTGRHCIGSPYQRAVDAADNHDFDSPQFRLAARAMLRYLLRLAARVEVE